MSSLAGYLRQLAESGIFDKDDIISQYEKWVIEEKYMIMCHEREKWL
jgi:hypothetical protein